MDNKRIFTDEELHYLRLLSRQYPTVEAAGTEIIRLQTIICFEEKPYLMRTCLITPLWFISSYEATLQSAIHFLTISRIS